MSRTLKVTDLRGGTVGEVDIPETLVEARKGDQAVHDSVSAYLAGLRAGTASTKGKGAVAGSNRKPWQQKGTGRARAGYRQSPVWRGGGVAFGPHPRSYAVKVNRKVAQLAFRRAFSSRLLADEVRILDEIVVAEPRTKLFSGMVKALGLTRGALLVVDRVDRNLVMASRNVPKFEVVAAKDVSTYQVLRYPVIVCNRAGMEQIKQRLAGGQHS